MDVSNDSRNDSSRIENDSFIKSHKNQISNGSREYGNNIKVPEKSKISKDFSKPNGILFPIKDKNHDTRPAFNSSGNGNQSHQLKPSKLPNSVFSCKENSTDNYDKQLNFDLSNSEREMPNLIKESENDQRSSLLKVFNQRYQNVRQFPNFRHRKKRAFEKKLKNCGLELDGEITISILRQFLQPFMYRDINSILNEYIEKYFMKAFNNIRENINITSENWSQILKCSISKSLYKEYCVKAEIDPFDPVSTDVTDFQCFPTVCKVPSQNNPKNGSTHTDILAKAHIDNSTASKAVSDTNSEISNSPMNGLNEQLKINPTELSHSGDQSFSDSDPEPKSRTTLLGKRNIGTDETEYNCLSRKFSKITNATQSHASNLAGSSNDIISPTYFSSRFPNHYRNVANNLSENHFDQSHLQSAPFENNNISFFSNNFNSSSLPKNPSLSAIQPVVYLNSSHNSIKNTDNDNRYFQIT